MGPEPIPENLLRWAAVGILAAALSLIALSLIIQQLPTG